VASNPGRSRSRGAQPGSEESKLEQLLPVIQKADDKGLKLEQIATRILGKSRSEAQVRELQAKLDSLAKAGTIRCLIKKARAPKQTDTRYYFAAGRGPSLEAVSAAIARFALEAGPLSRADLTKKITGLEQLVLDEAIKHSVQEAGAIRCLVEKGKKGKADTPYYFAAGQEPSSDAVGAELARLALEAGTRLLCREDLARKLSPREQLVLDEAIEHEVAGRTLQKLACGKLECYLHRDVAARHFGSFGPAADASLHAGDLALEDILPVYLDLKAQQRGLSAVTIADMLKKLEVSQDALHRLLRKEHQAGRITMHHATSVALSPEVLDAAIRLDGDTEPFVTIVVKGDR
jgi:hypothetical protein